MSDVERTTTQLELSVVSWVTGKKGRLKKKRKVVWAGESVSLRPGDTLHLSDVSFTVSAE